MMSLALCLGVAFFLLTGSAMAVGTTRLATGATASTYASELTLTPVTGGITYTLVGAGSFNSDLYRVMQVARTTAQNFTIVVTLPVGVTFAAGRLPAGGDVTVDSVSGGGAGAATFSVAAGGTAGSSSVTFLSNITATFTGFPTIKIASGANGWQIKDSTNLLATSTISATVQTFDAADASLIDGGGTDSAIIARTANAIVIPTGQTLVATTAVIDVGTNRQNFVATAPDTTTADNGASIGVGYAATVPLTPAGAAFALAATDKVRFTFTTNNDFTGFTTNLAGATTGITWNAVASTGTGTNRTIDIIGTDAAIAGGAKPFVFTVTGTTPLPTRIASVAIDLVLAAGGSTTNGGTRSLLGVSTVTTWTYNGSVLVANWVNGDTGAWKSRIYLWNQSTTIGSVSVRVFSTPLVSGGTATSTELTTPGSPLNLGSIAGQSSMAIRLYEDILGPSGLNIAPYTTNGGNLVVEITIRASGVRGTCQVFNNAATYSFGQTPLQVIQ